MGLRLERLVGGQHLVGIKHAVDDLGFASECLDHFGMDFRIFVGLEDLSNPMMAATKELEKRLDGVLKRAGLLK